MKHDIRVPYLSSQHRRHNVHSSIHRPTRSQEPSNGNTPDKLDRSYERRRHPSRRRSPKSPPSTRETFRLVAQRAGVAHHDLIANRPSPARRAASPSNQAPSPRGAAGTPHFFRRTPIKSVGPAATLKPASTPRPRRSPRHITQSEMTEVC